MTKGSTIIYYIWLIVIGIVYINSDKLNRVQSAIIIILLAMFHILCIIASELEKLNKKKDG